MTDYAPLLTQLMSWLDECREKKRCDTSDVMSQMTMITRAAAVVNDMISIYGSNVPPPVLEKIRELVSSFGHWSETDSAFYKLIQISRDKEYYKSVESKVFGGLSYCAKTIDYHSYEQEQFRQRCGQTCWLSLARDLMRRVRNDFASAEMKNEQTKQDIDSVLASLLLLEFFVNGSYWIENMPRLNALKQEVVQFKNSLES